MSYAKLTSLVFVLLSSLSHSQINHARFPGKRSQLPSPNGRYVLINVNPDQEPYQASILLKEKSTGKTRKIVDYDRHAAVVWSPDSKRFALNDYAGSDYTNTSIIAVDESIPRVDIQEGISSRVKNLARGHHEYFGVVRWLDPQHVVVQHWGHGPRIFCECFVYGLSGSVKRCARQSKSSDPEQSCEETTP